MAFTVAGIKFKFRSTGDLTARVVPNIDSHGSEVVGKLNLTEIVTKSHKITEIYELTHGSHLLPYRASLFTMSYFRGEAVERCLIALD
jgi:hypothetical protein